MTSLRKLLGDKRGNALLLMGAGLPMLIGAAGLASDTIQWSLWKRQLQKAADSAAIAGVYAKIASQDVNTAVTYDLGKNNQVGYTLLGSPAVGSGPDGADYNNVVTVKLEMQHALGFTSVFMATPPTITATANAAAVESGEYCVKSLIKTNATGISAGGNVTVDLGCGMITNSTSMDAAVAFGSSLVKATPVAAVGGLDKTDNWAAGTTLLPFTLAAEDPFIDVPPPTIPSGCNSNFSDSPGSNQTWPTAAPASGVVCVTNWNSKGTVNLQPNTTYIITGNMDANSGAIINCTGCTFVLTNSNPSSTGGVNFNGGATINVSAPDTGTYKGLVFYQNRGAPSGAVNKINGNSSSYFKGAFYFPNQEIEYTGNSGVNFDCVKLVSLKVSFMGNSKLKNNCPADWYGDTFKGRHVRLVG